MGRTRIPTEMQKGHLTKADIAGKEYMEQKVMGEKNELWNVTERDFVNSEACDEYFRVMREISKMSVIGNLDKAHLLGYANAYGYVRECIEGLKNGGLVDADGNVSAYVGLHLKYSDEVRKYARLCGLTVDSRLKAALTATVKENEELTDEYGDI